MKPGDVLRYDHEVLRAKLSSLEMYLPSCHDCGCTLSRLTDSLASCLRSHTEREERLLAALTFQYGEPLYGPAAARACRVGRAARPGGSLQHLHDEHENHRTRLAILHELLTHPESAAEEQIVTQASYLVKDLRKHMAVEERRFFPLLDGEGVGEVATTVDAEAVEMLGLA